MKTIIPTLTMLTLLGLTGCGKSESNDRKNDSSNNKANSLTSENKSFTLSTTRKVELQKDFSNLENFKNNINSYEVSFKAATGSYEGAKVECKNGQVVVAAKFNEKGLNAHLELSVLPTDPSKVQYDCTISDRGVELDTASVILKKSYIIDGTKGASSYIGAQSIGTLLIEKDSTLVAGEEWLNLEMDELISNEGKIITFDIDKARGTGSDRTGMFGGVLRMKVQKAIGDLTVELRGTNGGEHTKTPGKNLTTLPRDPATNPRCSGQRDRNNPGCIGKKGATGLQGYTGFEGYPAGDSGSLNMEITDTINFKIAVNYYPGQGGNGSPGGEGGNGAPGGIGATIKWITYGGCGKEGSCNSTDHTYKFPDGPTGDQGPVGQHGPKGRDGRKTNSYIKFVNANMEFDFNDDWKNY